MKNIFKKIKNQERGVVLLAVLIFAIIAISIMTALMSWFSVAFQNSKINLANHQAFQIAEAGIEYSRFYDISNATSTSYVQDFRNSQNEIVGTFSINFSAIEIVLPIEEMASTTATTTEITIESIGYPINYPNIQRKIRLKLLLASSTESGEEYQMIDWQEVI
jgi:Tfp pilus assembly protein PilX